MKKSLPGMFSRFSSMHMLLLIASLALFTSLSKYVFVYYSYLLFSAILVPLAYLSGGISLFSPDERKSPAFQALIALFLWVFVSAVVNERRGESLLANQAELGAMAVLVFVCFPAGYLANRNIVQSFLKWAGIITVSAVTLTDAAAIAMALTGNYIMLPFNAQYGLGIMPRYQRLAALCYPNSIGMIGMICVVLAIYLFLKTKRVLWRALYAASVFIISIAIALANARTSEIALAFTLGLIAFALAFRALLKRKALARWLIAVLAAFCIAAASFGLNSLVLRGFNRITAPQAAQASVETQPSAETTPATPAATTTAVDRPIGEDIASFNGRTAIWQAAFTEMYRDKSILLFGTSAGLAEEVIGQYEAAQGRNLHNSFLQVLFALGIPGFALMLGFLLIVLIAAVRVFFAGEQPGDAERLLPAALAAILVLSCMESFLLLYPDAYFANFWFVFLSGVICRIAHDRRSNQIAE